LNRRGAAGSRYRSDRSGARSPIRNVKPKGRSRVADPEAMSPARRD
jgi:hypothetical protein